MVEKKKILRGREGDKASTLEKSDTLPKKKRFADVVCDEDDGLVEAASQGTEFALKFGAGDRIKSTERLIHE